LCRAIWLILSDVSGIGKIECADGTNEGDLTNDNFVSTTEGSYVHVRLMLDTRQI